MLKQPLKLVKMTGYSTGPGSQDGGASVETVQVETVALSYFSVINIRLGWPSVAQALEARVTKPQEHSVTRATELMESVEEE